VASAGRSVLIEGDKDHTVPWAIAHAAYKRQRRNPAVTEIVKIPNRGHALTIDHGWREVAQVALDFVERSLPNDDGLAEEDHRDAHSRG
jgi:non-heme chloroperoxidase